MAKNTNTTPATANDVRAWAENRAAYKGKPFVTKTAEGKFPRGRLPLGVIADFTEKTGRTYAAGPVRSASAAVPVELSIKKADKNGRLRTRKVKKTRAEILEAAGLATNHKGALSKATLAAAVTALSDTAPESTPAPVEVPAEA